MTWITETALTVLVALGLSIVGFAYGAKHGKNSQKAADQIQFDKINAERTAQKEQAAATMQKAQQEIISLQAERAAFNARLEKVHADNAAAIDALRSQLATRGLRFRAPQGAGNRSCSANPQGSAPSAPSSAPATVIQLPDSIARDLRQLTFDADQLSNEYRKCYAWSQHTDSDHGEVK